MGRADELFFDLAVKGGPKANRAMKQFTGELDRAGRSTRRTRGELGLFSERTAVAERGVTLLTRALKGLGVVFAARYVARFVRNIAALAGELINISSNIQEVGNRFSAVFGPEAEPLLDRLSKFRRIAGLTTTELKDLAGSTGDILTGFGFTQKAAADLSESVLRAAGDLASFTNMPVADAAARITKALTGEADSMKALGIAVYDTDVNQLALLRTGKKTTNQLTLQDKAAARLALIQRQMVASTGDLERTQGSMANRLRRSSARLREMRDAVAVLLTPAFTKLVEVIDTEVGPAIDSITTILEGNVPTVKEGALALGRAIGSAIAIGINEGLAFALRELPNVFLKLVPGDFAEKLPKPTDLVAKLLESSADDARELLERSIRELQAIAAQARADVLQRRRRGGAEPPPSPTPSNASVDASEENAAKVEALNNELADRVAAITLTAAEQQIASVQKLRVAYEKAYKDDIPAAVEDGLRIAEEAASKAFRLEQAEQLADTFRTEIADGLREITLLSQDFTDEEERRAFVLEQQLRLFQIEQTRVNNRLKATETTKEEEEALRDVLAEIVELLVKARDEQEGLGDAAAKDADQRFRNLQHTVSLIQQSVDGALELAKAFGLVDDQLAGVIKNLQQIGAGTATLAAAIKSKNPEGIVAGALQLAGGLAGLVTSLFKESPEDVARRKIIEENTKALEELRRNVHELAGKFDITGSDFSRALQSLQGLDFSGALVFRDLGTLYRRLNELGLSIADLEDVAAEFDIQLLDETGKIIPTALRDLQTALEGSADFFIGFPETVEGTLQRLQVEFDLLDVTDPVDQLQRLQEELGKLTAAGEGVPAFARLFGLDLTTAEGRAQAEALIETLFRQLVNREILPEQLGATTFDEAVDILKQMETLLDDIEANTEEGAGTTQGVHFSTQVTEAQGDALLAREDTQIYFAREELKLSQDRNALLESMLAAMSGQLLVPPPALSPAGSGLPAPLAGGATEVSVTIQHMELQVGAGATPEMAREAADVFVENVDRRLGEKLLAQLRLRGRA